MSKHYAYSMIGGVMIMGVMISFGVLVLCKNGQMAKKDIKIETINFEDSMQVKLHTAMLADSSTSGLLSLFKRVYEKNHPGRVISQSTIKIPRYLHVIWLGSKFPPAYESFYRSWLAHHPSWVHIFWTDNPANYGYGTVVLTSFDELKDYLEAHARDEGVLIVMDTSKLVFDNKVFFDVSRNYGERSDILRWEIIFRFGGLYVDADFECIRPLDELHYCYDFYTGLQPLDTKYVQLGAALFGAVPGHPIVAACVYGIKNNQHILPIVAKTGPMHFTRSFLMHVNDGNYINIAFPASFFYPRGYDQRTLPTECWQKNEAFAVHHWAGSWLKPEGFVCA